MNASSEDPCEHIKQVLIEYVGPEVYWHFQNQNDWVFFTYVFENYKDIPIEEWGDCFPFEDRDTNVKTVAEYYHTDKKHKDAFRPTVSESDQMDAIYTLINTKIESLTSILNMVETDQDYEDNAVDIINLQTEISQLSMDWEGIIDAINTGGASILQGLGYEIDALPVDFDFHNEIKYVSNIKVLIDLSGIESITSVQWDVIRNIAESCILKNGTIVYDAQQLLIQEGDYNFQTNEDCYESVPRKEQNPLQEITCFPNPSNGIFHLDVGNKDGRHLQIEIFDINGRIIYSNKLNDTKGTIEIDLANQINGIYYLKINNNDSIIYQKKLILIK